MVADRVPGEPRHDHRRQVMVDDGGEWFDVGAGWHPSVALHEKGVGETTSRRVEQRADLAHRTTDERSGPCVVEPLDGSVPEHRLPGFRESAERGGERLRTVGAFVTRRAVCAAEHRRQHLRPERSHHRVTLVVVGSAHEALPEVTERIVERAALAAPAEQRPEGGEVAGHELVPRRVVPAPDGVEELTVTRE